MFQVSLVLHSLGQLVLHASTLLQVFSTQNLDFRCIMLHTFGSTLTQACLATCTPNREY